MAEQLLVATTYLQQKNKHIIIYMFCYHKYIYSKIPYINSVITWRWEQFIIFFFYETYYCIAMPFDCSSTFKRLKRPKLNKVISSSWGKKTFLHFSEDIYPIVECCDALFASQTCFIPYLYTFVFPPDAKHPSLNLHRHTTPFSCFSLFLSPFFIYRPYIDSAVLSCGEEPPSSKRRIS